MIEENEKSTAAAGSSDESAGLAEIAPDIWLDSRLALVHRASRWLAVADVHYGYELSRRAAGGLFPLWGMETIEQRFAALLEKHAPETVILAGDTVDSGMASREALDWLASVRERCDRLVLVAGNHDRGAIRRELDFVDSFEPGDGFFFHHGHESPMIPERTRVEVSGHLHPSVSLNDGAGLSLKLPSLVCETLGERQHWFLPAFSPWAGGGGWKRTHPDAKVRQWACGKGRVLEFGE